MLYAKYPSKTKIIIAITDQYDDSRPVPMLLRIKNRRKNKSSISTFVLVERIFMPYIMNYSIYYENLLGEDPHETSILSYVFARFQFCLNEYLVSKCFKWTCRINTKLHNTILNVLIVRTVVSLSFTIILIISMHVDFNLYKMIFPRRVCCNWTSYSLTTSWRAWSTVEQYVMSLEWTTCCEVSSIKQKLSLSVEAVLYSTLHEALDSYREQDIAAGESSTLIVR